MAKFKELLLQIRYPYATLIIAIIWLGSAVLVAADNSLPLGQILILNSLVSIFIAILGFPTPKR